MQAVGIGADADSSWNVGVTLDGGTGGRKGGDARLLSGRGGVKTEGFRQDVVEEGERVDGARGGQETLVPAVCVGGVVAYRVDDWRGEGEEFGAETVLEIGALGEFVHEIGKGDTRRFMAGDEVV